MTRWSPSSWPKARMSRSIYEIQRSKKQLPKLSCSSTFQCIQIVLIDIKSLRFKAVFFGWEQVLFAPDTVSHGIGNPM